MKKTILIPLIILIFSVGLMAQDYKDQNYGAKGIFYIGWQASNNSMKNAYSINEGENYTFYNDGFFFHHIDWRIGVYGNHCISEIDLTGVIDGLLLVFNALDEIENENNKGYWSKNGKLRKISENFPGYEGIGWDWSIGSMDIAFGGKNLFIGPNLGYANLGVRELSNPSSNVQAHGFCTYMATGLTTYYFQDGIKYKLNTDYFLNRTNKIQGIIINPEVTFMPLNWLTVTAYYRYQSANLNKSELFDHEYLKRHTIHTIGMKCNVIIKFYS